MTGVRNLHLLPSIKAVDSACDAGSLLSLSTGNDLALRTKLKSLPAEYQGTEATNQPMSVSSKAFFRGSVMRLQIPRIGLMHQQKYPPVISPRYPNILQISPRNFPQKYPVCYLEASRLWSTSAFYSIFSVSTLSDLNILWDWATLALVYETHSRIYEKCSHIPYSFNPQPALWGRWKRTVGIRTMPITGTQDIIVWRQHSAFHPHPESVLVTQSSV